MISSRLRAAAVLAVLAVAGTASMGAEPLRVGSKRFTESYILGEILAQSARAAGAQAEHLPGMGNTAILFEALQRGAIDAYPSTPGRSPARSSRRRRQPGPRCPQRAARADGPRRERALRILQRLRAGHARSRGRGEGHRDALGPRAPPGRRAGPVARVPAARGRLAGAQGRVRPAAGGPRGLDHGLAYEALEAGQVEAIDLYTTDAKIARSASGCSPTTAASSRATTPWCCTASTRPRATRARSRRGRDSRAGSTRRR